MREKLPGFMQAHEKSVKQTNKKNDAHVKMLLMEGSSL